jgi:class 3 adenylate cyclase
VNGRPPVLYAPTSGGYLAYQIVGEGPIDVAYLGSIASNLEAWWDYGPAAAYLRGWGSFSRLVIHDRRGTGLSDAGGLPHNLMPTGRVAIAEDHPWGATPQELEELAAITAATWGSEEHAAQALRHARIDPDDLPGLAAFQARMDRMACGPATAREFYRILAESDVRSALAAVRVPTLLIDRESFDDRERAETDDVARRIPSAEILRLPAGPRTTMMDRETLFSAVRRFLGIAAPPASCDTVLTTVLFTDMVDSTRLQATHGDSGWKEIVEQHHAVVRDQLARYDGTEQDTAGDGFYARFDGPARAIRCAQEIVTGVRELGLEVRAGIHTGECEIADGKCSGLSVSIGARVMSHAGPSEVLVSSTVKDLVAGSGLTFEDAGEHELKGVPDRWHLYRVVA